MSGIEIIWVFLVGGEGGNKQTNKKYLFGKKVVLPLVCGSLFYLVGISHMDKH